MEQKGKLVVISGFSKDAGKGTLMEALLAASESCWINLRSHIYLMWRLCRCANKPAPCFPFVVDTQMKIVLKK